MWGGGKGPTKDSQKDSQNTLCDRHTHTQTHARTHTRTHARTQQRDNNETTAGQQRDNSGTTAGQQRDNSGTTAGQQRDNHRTTANCLINGAHIERKVKGRAHTIILFALARQVAIRFITLPRSAFWKMKHRDRQHRPDLPSPRLQPPLHEHLKPFASA